MQDQKNTFPKVIFKSILKISPKKAQDFNLIDTENTLFNFSNEDYLPVEKQNIINVFFQNQIEYEIINSDMQKIEGSYEGVLGGLYVKPNGLGEWIHVNEENHIQISYSGQWRNGLWHGIGNFFETFQTNSLKISVEIKNGLFFNGKLVSDESSSDAHITINKNLDDDKMLEIHLYGQMREHNSKNMLKFLQEASFSKNFYFHNETIKNSFQRLSQIHIVGNHLRKKGYQIVGNWIIDDENRYKLGNSLKNEIEEEKRILVDNFTNGEADLAFNELKEVENELTAFLNN